MGRINEALRRAAEATEPESPDNPYNPTRRTPTRFADDIEALSREAFPIEIEEHRKTTLRQAGAPAATPVAASTPPAVSGSPATAPPARTAQRETPAAPVVTQPRTTSSAILNRIDSSLAGKIVVDTDTAPASREQYRRLAATLHHAQAASGLKVVMVTSALMGEGKTLTASNLALTLSESYKKSVLLIDGDLRRPALHSLFKIESSPGLSEGLFSEEQQLAVRQVSPRLGVLTAGRPNLDPIAGLTSPRMLRVVEEAREAFDWVIIDTPPVAVLPDANLLAAMADGAILVVRADSTPWDMAQRAVQAIGRDRLLGVVLNHSNAPLGDTSYGYYDYAGESSTKVPPSS